VCAPTVNEVVVKGTLECQIAYCNACHRESLDMSVPCNFFSFCCNFGLAIFATALAAACGGARAHYAFIIIILYVFTLVVRIYNPSPSNFDVSK